MRQNTVEPIQDVPEYTFFLFINSGSGAGLGQRLVSQEIDRISFSIPIDNQKDIRPIDVYFINMRKNKAFGFKKLKELNQLGRKTVAVICGGDGTVVWIVNQFAKSGIDPMATPLVVIPLGTGNDFSRNLHWGGEKTMLLEYNFRSLKKLVRKWIHAKVCDFDLWDVTAEVYENGKLEKVQNGQNVAIQQKWLKKTFANYFSFGIDGKVGYSFDMHRTSSRIGNLAMYGALGLIKEATRSKTIDELIESFYICKTDNESDGKLVFKSKLKTDNKEQNQDNSKFITPGLKNILFLNIDSYTGGVSGIWNSAKEIFNHNSEARSPPIFSDGLIEVVSFGSGAGIALQRSIGGFSSRIAQDDGPFIFNFRQYPNQQKHRTYLQIDGEYLRFTHPKRVKVEKSRIVKDGKIRVLLNDPNFVPYCPKE